jgi:hypothetical protein
MTLSIQERVFLVEYAFLVGNRYTEFMQDHFAEKFPEISVPHPNAFRRLIEKFCETGPVLDTEGSWKPSKLKDKTLKDISDSMLRSPSKSLIMFRQAKDIGLATVHKSVRKKN